MSWALLALLLGCGLRSESSPSTEAVFPHDEDFAAVHGLRWREDSASCQRCHAPLGQAPSSGPACTECHPAYPHTAALAAGEVHGAAWLSDRSRCADCHGAEGERVVAEVAGSACTGCHATFPHPTDALWLAEHGAAVRARGGADTCVACHPAEGAEPGACATCHGEAYPHPPGWEAAAAHGQAASASCAACHGPPAPAGTPACATCHDTYPHPADWLAFGHVPVVQSRGEAGCLGCHEAESARRIPHRCATACHGEPP